MLSFGAYLANRCAHTVARVALLILAMAGVAHAQRVQFRHLRSGDGLAGPWVQAITQDHRGFMWFGTAQGLSRYDGYTMHSYRHEKGDTTSLPDNTIHALLEDHLGTLWIGTAGQGIFRIEKGAVRNFSMANGMRSNGIRQLLEDQQGAMWAATGSGLTRWDGNT